jgi:hypothetical protein
LILLLNAISEFTVFKLSDYIIKEHIYSKKSKALKKGVSAMPRGGARQGAGRPKKPLAEKILEGNPGRRPLKVVEFYGVPAEGTLTPPDFLKIASKETAENYPTADQIYTQISEWLQTTGVAHLISPTLIEDFCINRRAFFECEYMNIRRAFASGYATDPLVHVFALEKSAAVDTEILNQRRRY